MASPTIDELRKENIELRELALRLARIIRDDAVERRLLAATRGSDLAPCLLTAVTPIQTVDRLREAALLCSRLGGADQTNPSFQSLSDLGVELAVEAGDLAALLRLISAGQPTTGS